MKLWILSGCFDVYLLSIVALWLFFSSSVVTVQIFVVSVSFPESK